MTQTVEILCAHCHVPLKGPAEPNADDRFSCPVCGEGDSREAVVAEVGEYVKEMAAKKLAESLAKTAATARFVRVESTFKPSNRHWRFIANVDM
jgi:hypothetical protein